MVGAAGGGGGVEGPTDRPYEGQRGAPFPPPPLQNKKEHKEIDIRKNEVQRGKGWSLVFYNFLIQQFDVSEYTKDELEY